MKTSYQCVQNEMEKEEKIMTSVIITDDKVEVIVFTLKDTKTKR